MLQCFRIGQRFDVPDRIVVNDISYRQLHDFAAFGPRDIGHLHNLCRYMPRRSVLADLILDCFYQCIVQRNVIP